MTVCTTSLINKEDISKTYNNYFEESKYIPY